MPIQQMLMTHDSIGYDGPLGLTDSLLTISGENAVWTEQTIDISEYAGTNAKLVFRYVSGSNFESDIQIDDINFDGNTYGFETDNDNFEVNDTDDVTVYENISWEALTDTLSNASFNRNSGTTGSSGTGDLGAHSGSFYIYYEATSGGSPNITGWARSETIELDDEPTLSFWEGREGANIGTLDVFLDIISSGSPGVPVPPAPAPDLGLTVVATPPSNHDDRSSGSPYTFSDINLGPAPADGQKRTLVVIPSVSSVASSTDVTGYAVDVRGNAATESVALVNSGSDWAFSSAIFFIEDNTANTTGDIEVTITATGELTVCGITVLSIIHDDSLTVSSYSTDTDLVETDPATLQCTLNYVPDSFAFAVAIIQNDGDFGNANFGGDIALTVVREEDDFSTGEGWYVGHATLNTTETGQTIEYNVPSSSGTSYTLVAAVLRLT